MQALRAFVGKYRNTLALSIILGLAFLSLCLWLEHKDYSTLASENAKHLAKAYELYHKLQAGEPLGATLNTITYPPVFYLPAVLFFWLTQCANARLAILSVFVFIVLTAWATFGLSRKLTPESNLAPLLSTLTIVSLMVSSLELEGYLIEYAMAALLTATFYFLLDSDYLEHRTSAVLAGACAGLTLLIKWTLPAYLCGALVIGAYLLWREPLKRSLRLRNLLTAALLALAISSTWYLACHGRTSNLEELWQHFSHSRSSELAMHQSRSSAALEPASSPLETLQTALLAPPVLLKYVLWELIPFPLLLSTLVSLGLWKKHVNNQPLRLHYSFILVTLLSCVTIFAFYPTPALLNPLQTLRHLSPIAPLACVLAFGWLPLLKRKAWLVTLPATLLALLTLGNWALPSSSLLFNHPWLGPKHCPLLDSHTKVRDIRRSDSLAPLCQELLAWSRQGYWLVLDLTYDEKGFHPLITELYSLDPKIKLYLGSPATKAKPWQLTEIHPLTQVISAHSLQISPSLKQPGPHYVWVKQTSRLRYNEFQVFWPVDFTLPAETAAEQHFYLARPFAWDIYRLQVY